MDSLKGLKRALPVALAVIVVDQLTKWWAVSNLEEGSCSASEDACLDLVLGFSFHLHFNTGAAFSTGTGLGPFIGALALVVALFLLGSAYFKEDVTTPILYGFLAGGVLGNFLDRLFRAKEGLLSGGVVDFIDPGWFPIFNIADSVIVCGVALIIFLSFRESKKEDDDFDEDLVHV